MDTALAVSLTVVIPCRQESVVVGCGNGPQVDERVPRVGIDLTDLVCVGAGVPILVSANAADKSEYTYQTALSSSSLE